MKLLLMFEATNLTLNLKYLLHCPIEQFVQLMNWIWGFDDEDDDDGWILLGSLLLKLILLLL